MKFEESKFDRKRNNQKDEVLDYDKLREAADLKIDSRWAIPDDVVDEMLAELREQENANHE